MEHVPKCGRNTPHVRKLAGVTTRLRAAMRLPSSSFRARSGSSVRHCTPRSDLSYGEPVRTIDAAGVDDIVVPLDAAHALRRDGRTGTAGHSEIAGEGEAVARIARRGEVAQMTLRSASHQQLGLLCRAGTPLEQPKVGVALPSGWRRQSLYAAAARFRRAEADTGDRGADRCLLLLEDGGF